MVSTLIIFAVLSRLMPHPANFTPILAIALFGGANIEDKKLAFIIPFASMLLSDIFLGFHTTMLFVYLGFALCVYFGFQIRKNNKISKILSYTLTGSILFFIITNFGSWLTDPMYSPLNLSSLIQCYTLALPFFRNAILGDLVYTTVIFGAFALAAKNLPVLSKVK